MKNGLTKSSSRKAAGEGAKFERRLARMFRRLGYGVRRVGGSNDHGADLILTRRRKRIAVQAKHYAKPVGNAAVQEVFAAKAYYQCTDAWVVTNASFTAAAVEQARPCGVRLVDGAALKRLSARAQARTWLPAALALAAVALVTALLVLESRGALPPAAGL